MFVVETLTGLPLLNIHIYPQRKPVPTNAHEIYVVETLLNAVSAFRQRFPEMAQQSPEWERVIAAWDALLKSLTDELARGNQLAPETSRKLNVCLDTRGFCQDFT